MTTLYHVEHIVTHGATLIRSLVPRTMLQSINHVMHKRAEHVMKLLGGQPIGIGSREGYRELVQRSPGRFDVPLTEAELVHVWGAAGSMAAHVPWLGLVRAVLGQDVLPSFCGVVFSRPGSPAQQWHIDSPHEAVDHRPAHALNVLVALADIPSEAGPTEVAYGSHLLTNHLRSHWLCRDNLLYQTETEITPDALGEANTHSLSFRDTTSFNRSHYNLQSMRAGDCLVFDDRILHRGLANRSSADRWVAYFAYFRPRAGLIEETHFEASRSLLTHATNR
eukprot:CAMPEP_0119317028 /NCGR_PEP_ID=MMETSP1333-20130426/41668_1 /TAXON_ID=418940 /ORGANISM="Scyphosphaera apsteinii, Strain RCC1455" /LENGTH=278 /DNA_ID=CAMNT_0007322839 /DNA_START=152 /DNA_END=988 /DNA_ORIENTATION=-